MPLDPSQPEPAPLILTLGLNDTAFNKFDTLRRVHFPPERNHLAAHLTLFHHLPGLELPGILDTLAEVCAATPPVPLRVEPPRSLGRGVAYPIAAPALLALRAGLAAAWAAWLTPQDRQGWRPHVTVQNKVAPAAAAALLAHLAAGHVPWEATGETLLLWHYLGGPWAAAGAFPLRGG